MASSTFFESLPYIDTVPSPASLAAAKALIEEETGTFDTTVPHPRLPPLSPSSPTNATDAMSPAPSPFYTEAMRLEDERVKAKQPLKAIDTSRYQAAGPEDGSSSSAPSRSELIASLERSMAQSTHLRLRQAHLQQLEQHGKNVWLIGNYHLELQLQQLERELADTKREIETVNGARRQAQEAVAGEMKLLEDGWKTGVGKVLETELAVEGLRSEAKERLRRTAAGEISA